MKICIRNSCLLPFAYCVVVSLMIPYLPLDVFSQDMGSQNSGKKGGISQLSFGIGSTKSRTQAPTEKIVEAPQKQVVKSFSGETYKENKDEIASAPMLIPPLDRSPETDTNPDTISSVIKWQKANGESCRLPGDDQNYCLKASALREVLRRFSGSDEFYDSHCLRKCQKDGYVARMHFLSFDTNRREEIKVIDNAKNCAISVSKLTGRKWLTLDINQVECVCLPSEGC